ncbi:hypothetical protein, partial [Pelomonas sp. KK5]|uniref:hypothetical protein n=1 Tax=Pelomonas sp. KK5 TaxID=1855730 RepID=UPI001E5A9382
MKAHFSFIGLLALTASLSAVAASTQKMASPSVSSAVVARFKECVSPSGLRERLPVATDIPELDQRLGLPLSEAGLVADGYYHWLHITQDQGTAYIVQIGGISGTRTVFGPFSVDRGCAAASSSKSAPVPNPQFQPTPNGAAERNR